MRYLGPKAAAILAGTLLTVSAACAQQSSSNTPQTTSPSSQSSDDNAFPEAISKKAAKEAADRKKADDQQDQAQDQQGSSSAAAPKPSRPASDDNAFPEDESRKAADAAKGTSASSSSSGVSSSGEYDDRVAGSGRNAIKPNAPMPHLNGKDPVKEDLNVGSLYLETGNYAGAYQRYKEATTLAPENTDAMFGLAEAARHLKKFDEAMTNYQLFLQIVDSGPKAKDARKAVATLEKASK